MLLKPLAETFDPPVQLRLHFIYRLCTNSHLRSPEDFFQRTLMASFLLRCLRKANFFQTGGDNQVSPSRAEYEIGEMLLFNLQVLQFNAHEVYETRSAQTTEVTIIMRDFIAKIGAEPASDVPYVGTFGLGDRNERAHEREYLLFEYFF
ncbi:hypothetical protein HUJ04_007006 [Dendroctonus ponderosae]|nr:hypothetical protein HUJ04_007006 [Dendroctonus ponderosae]